MDFDAEWATLGKHRVRLRSTRGFPTETLRTVADVARLAIENNMSARARLVEAVFRDQDKAYDILVGTTGERLDMLCGRFFVAPPHDRLVREFQSSSARQSSDKWNAN